MNLYLFVPTEATPRQHVYHVQCVTTGSDTDNMQNGSDEAPLFDGSILKKIDWDSRKANFRNGVSLSNPGENLVLRPLCLGDYDRGFLQLLQQLTSVGDIQREQFKKRFDDMKACAGTYYITVLEDTSTNQVIGAASLVVEQKFIHCAATRGRIEDVVVNDEYRGKQLGKLLVEVLTLLGKAVGCYKMSLECSDEKKPFYENFGYTKDPGHFMVQRYKD